MTFKSNVRNLLLNCKIDEALEQLLDVGDNDFRNVILLLAVRNNRLKNNNSKGIINYEDSTIESNHILQAILYYVDTLSDNIAIPVKSNVSSPNQTEMLSKIIEVKKFLKDYKEDLYPNVQGTRNLVYTHTEWAHNYFKQLFPETSTEYKSTFIPWRQLLVDTKLDNEFSKVKVLIKTLEEFINEVSNEEVDKEKKTEEETLFEIAKRENSTFDAIDNYVKYKISRNVADTKEQLQNDWDTAVKEFNQITGMFAKPRALNGLRDKWVVKNL